MKITKIIIRKLFGISELNLDGSSVELTGTNGSGKTSVLDAIRLAITNRSTRDVIIKQGETEGEILLETDTGLSINRKPRANQADYKSIKEGNQPVQRPEEFLQSIFTPMQLNPVLFTQLSTAEKNRIILDLIEFKWDLNWIKEQFGEIPQGADYSQNILQVLADIQSERGQYYQTRQAINSEKLHKTKSVADIAKDIPAGYTAEKWEKYDLGAKYRELQGIQNENNLIQRAKTFLDGFAGKMRGFEAERDSAILAEEKAIGFEREQLTAKIARLKAEIAAAEQTITGLGERLEDKKKVAQAEFEAKVARLKGENEQADQYATKAPKDTAALSNEITTAEVMKKHLNEYARMISMQAEVEELKAKSDELTRKIELARSLPGEILKTATIPVDGLTVKDGVPLINGLPISNLSEGEQLDLCVDVAISKPNGLEIILIDGAEKLSDVNRTRLYEKCKAKGLQFVATRTTNENELTVTTL